MLWHLTIAEIRPMNDNQLLRYSRHILLDEIGIEGQQRLLAAHVLIIGAGGLGSPAACYLAAAGVGHITLVDHDTVDLTNLQRQIMHTTQRIGQHKVASGKEMLTQINPEINIIALAERAEGARLEQLVQAATVVLDCTDNFATRHAINRACVKFRTPLISGAAIRFDGQISVFDLRRDDAPCYACLFPPHREYEDAACSTMGIFAPVVGIIGTMQAAEALKLIIGIGESLTGRLLLLEAKTMEWNTIRVKRDAHCAVCATTATIDHRSPD